MDKIHEIAGDGARMPRFDDGMVNMAELIRAMAESLVNEIMDAQADEACEAGNQRNGCRERRLTTSVGTVNLRIPKPRAGSYFPEDLIGRYSRTDRAVIAAVPEMVTNGVSTSRRQGRRRCCRGSGHPAVLRPGARLRAPGGSYWFGGCASRCERGSGCTLRQAGSSGGRPGSGAPLPAQAH